MLHWNFPCTFNARGSISRLLGGRRQGSHNLCSWNSLCAILGKSHMSVSPLLKQVSTTWLPQLWLCSSSVKGCRNLCQGWEMGIAIGGCWLLAWPEFQPRWSVSMVISWDVARQAFALGCFLEGQTEADSQAMSLGRWAGRLGLLPVEMGLPPWVCAWQCCQAAAGRSRPSSCCRRALARSGKQILVQPRGRNCHVLVSLQRREVWQLHTDTRYSQRCPKRAAPQRVCRTPSWAVWLGQVEPKLPEQRGRVRRAPGPRCSGPTAVPQNPQQYKLPSPLPPGLACSPGLGNEPAGKGRVSFLPLWTSLLFCHT